MPRLKNLAELPAMDPLPLPDGSVVFATNEGDKIPLYRSAADGSERRALVPSGFVNFSAQYAERAGIRIEGRLAVDFKGSAVVTGAPSAAPSLC